MKKNFVFGYGSLICTECRQKTIDSPISFPVVLEGYQRSWNTPASANSFVVLGINPEKDALCNGVLFEASKDQLKCLDDREKGYNRLSLDRNCLWGFNGNGYPKGDYWAYAPKNLINEPSLPIVQSYVDVVIKGCILIDPDFAKDFILQTTGWDKSWRNDRDNPVYIRHLENNGFSAKIDQILLDLIPEKVKKRIEN